MSNMLFLLDEPAGGLDSEAEAAVLGVMERLLDEGNSVLVVSHRRAVIERAAHVIEFGPGPGHRGGQVVFAGSVSELRRSETATGRWLRGDCQPPEPSGSSKIEWVDGIDGHRLPLCGAAVLRGPSGCGKTLLLGQLEEAARERGGRSNFPEFERILTVKRVKVSRSKVSLVATYVGLWNTMRELFGATAEAQVRGLTPSMFSLAVRGGRCEACKGLGTCRMDMGVLADVWVQCEACAGRRFNADLLEVRWKGMSACDLLQCTVHEARGMLAGHPRLERPLRALEDVGLGYLVLGQSSVSLSGGEAQRLRLARELAKGRGVEGALLLLDEPTMGLHPVDVIELLSLLSLLVSKGATIWLASSDSVVASWADHVVNLG